MKVNICLSIISIFLIVGCIGSKVYPTNSTSDFFEGKIIYDINYISKQENVSNEQIQKFVGSKMIFYTKDGNTRKEYYNTEGKLVSFRIFNQKDHMSYMMLADEDTIFYYDPIVEEFDNEIKKEEKIYMIADYECSKISVISTPKAGFDKYGINSSNYYITPKLKVNTEWFSNFNEGAYNTVVLLGKGCSLGIDLSAKWWDQELRATEVIPEKLDDKLFIINKNKPMKEI